MFAGFIISAIIILTRGYEDIDYHLAADPSGSLEFIDDISNIAGFGDAQHRGDRWNPKSSDNDATSDSDLLSSFTGDETSSIETNSRSISSSASSGASSIETKEARLATKAYRVCTPCPEDMLKKHTNRGIKWICASYQRARRTFKSECMMRFRNCQDGTMFVKLYSRRCKDDRYHGRHWFYIYKV